MIKAIVTAVEGTLSPPSFASNTLLPYAREHLRRYILKHQETPAVLTQLEAVCGKESEEVDVVQCCELLEAWMDEGRSSAALSALQELLWREGYRNGELLGEFYADTVRNLRNWKGKGISLYTYSDSSVEAQQLLFRHNPFGDLTALFCEFFDTRIGHKQDSSSFEVIVSRINERAGDILYLSESTEELNAARAAGMQTRCLVREGQMLDTMAAHPQVRDFDAINLD